MTSTPVLAACPFCGSTDLHIETRDVQPDDFHDAYVVCGDCDAQGRHAMTVDGWLPSKDEARSEAMAAWNRRAESEDVAALRHLRDEVANLLAVKGRHHTEQAYQRVQAAFATLAAQGEQHG